MIEQVLESMVTHLVQCTCNGTINSPKTTNNGELEHDDLELKQPISTVCIAGNPNKTFTAWKNSILNGLRSKCTQFSSYGMDTFNTTNTLTFDWQLIHNRKVLAPLALKQNSDNIIAGNLAMKRKRLSDLDNDWTPPNKNAKLKVVCDDNLTLCSISLKRTSIRNLTLPYKCVSQIPFVKLFDVLKEIPQEQEEEEPVEQNDFMNIFGLENRHAVNTKLIPEIKTSHPIKLTKTVAIPFSSIYGRKLLSRERHCLPQDVALKKIERTDWYLKGRIPKLNNDYVPPVTYDKTLKYSRYYKFPKKQFYQKHKSLKQHFLEYICKPVCVRLEIIDVNLYLKNKEKVKSSEDLPVEESVVSVKKEQTILSDQNSPSCELILSESGTANVQNVNLQQMVAINDKYSHCLYVRVTECNQFSNMVLDDCNSVSKRKHCRRSSRLIANTM